MRDPHWKEFWAKKRAKRERLMDSGKVLISNVQGSIQVVCPYNPKFNDEAHRMAGRWRKRTKVWCFRAYQLPFVLDSCTKVYGASNIIYRVKQDVTSDAIPIEGIDREGSTIG